jgi:hypothetical protein
LPCSVCFCFPALLFVATPAEAQATRTWVSGVGDDANPCSRRAPCKTFAGAISKTAPSGEINCLDPGDFGAVTITKSITISCKIGSAGVLVAGTNGISVRAAATDVVVLNGLDFEGLGSGLIGINFIQAAALHVQHCRIAGFLAAPPPASCLRRPGRRVCRSSPNTVISENGNQHHKWRHHCQAGGTGIAKAALTCVFVGSNSVGIRTDGTGSTGGIHLTVTDCTISGNTNAFTPAGGAASNIFANRIVSVNNGTGYLADGSGAGVFLNNAVATANSTGVSAVDSGLTELRRASP